MMINSEEIGWNFDNSYARLPKGFFSNVNPASVPSPKLVILNHKLAASLCLNEQALQSEEGIQIFAGNKIPKGADPLAQAYAGHQFGHFNMLGDGRAILLGEHTSTKVERVDIQLKGAGRTPYSRGGDGRAALGPMLREYIMSEAMHALHIPTTRSLAVVTTGDSIFRETELPGAVLTRIAASHIRVGTFQFVSNWGTVDNLHTLADYTIQRHFPEIENSENKYLILIEEVIKRQAELIAKWQLVGFIHGVMNTDNMTISGETIDYGPCAFMDTYDPATVFSSIDRQGRYAYGNQPYIAGWNLARFAESLLPLLHEDEKQAVELAQEKISEFPELYRNHWLKGMRGKLGLFNNEDKDEELIHNLLNMMEKYKVDYTNTFRALTLNMLEDEELYKKEEFTKWYELWQERLGRQSQSKVSVQQLMKNSNPAIIPRNHRVEKALEAAVERGDYKVMGRLLQALSNPYTYSTEFEEYTKISTSTTPYQTFCGT
ncbi:protein adenylyltransferase SelO [Bacillus manliponensis]